MTTAAATVRTPQTGRVDGWRRFRFGLLAVVLAVLTCGGLVAQWPSSLGDLEAELIAGRVDQVFVEGGLSPQANGYATATVSWKDGLRHRFAQVMEVSDVATMTQDAESGFERVVGPVEAQLRPLDGSVQIVHTGVAAYRSSIAGWQVPDWLSLVGFLIWGATVFLLTQGPEPWWATRWAWFWGLLSPAAIVLVPLFLLVSGPPPGVRGASGVGRRLTGGWAFLLTCVLAAPFANS